MSKRHNILDRIEDMDRRRAKYAPVAQELRTIYGFPRWRQSWTPMDELVSCILSQSTTDANRDRGFEALKARYPAWELLRDALEPDVIETIRPAGLANQKGPRIQHVLRRIYDERGSFDIDFLKDMPIEDAKAWLTSLDGVGPKTAAIVLCFGFGLPAFPVDTHVHRVGQRIGFLPVGISADHAHIVMEALVPPDDYYAFHLNLIRHGRETCKARNPQCSRCPLQQNCDYFLGLGSSDDDKQREIP